MPHGEWVSVFGGYRILNTGALGSASASYMLSNSLQEGGISSTSAPGSCSYFWGENISQFNYKAGKTSPSYVKFKTVSISSEESFFSFPPIYIFTLY